MIKIRKILLLCVLLLFLAACAGQKDIASEQDVKEKTADSAAAKPAAEKADTTLSIETIKSETESRNDITKNLVIPITIKKGSIGSTVVFGAMVNKANMQPDSYFLTLEFIEARDKSYNRIEADKNKVIAWTKAQTDDFYLEDSKFVPISFTIGNEVKSGIKTLPGAYQFEVKLYKRIDKAVSDEVSGAVKQIYLKVE